MERADEEANGQSYRESKEVAAEKRELTMERDNRGNNRGTGKQEREISTSWVIRAQEG